MKKLIILFLLSSFIASCAPATPTPQTEVVNVYATSAAQPWLTELYTCANNSSILLNITANEPDITLRVGEPEIMISPVYQIDEEEILIVTNRESPVQNLTLAEAQDLFAQGNDSAQVWVYASDADVQIAFDQLVMKGRSVTSFAGLAASPQQMSDLIHAEKDAQIPLNEAYLLHDANKKAELWIVENAEHGMTHSVNPEGYEKRVVEFFKENIR